MLDSYKTLTFLTLGEFHTVLLYRDPFSLFLDISVLRFRDLQEWSPVILSCIKSSACRARTDLRASITHQALGSDHSALFWGTWNILFWTVGMCQVIRGDGNWCGPVTSEKNIYNLLHEDLALLFLHLPSEQSQGLYLQRITFHKGNQKMYLLFQIFHYRLAFEYSDLFPWLGHFLF